MAFLDHRPRTGLLIHLAAIGGITSAVRLAGAAKSVVIARAFGTGDPLDAYLMAFLIPSFAGDVLAGAIAPALLPVLVEVRERQGANEARMLAARVLAAATALLALVALAVAALSLSALRLLASGFSPAKLRMSQTLLYVMLPVLPLSAITGTFRTVLNARENFVLPAIAPVATPAAIAAAILLFGGTISLAAGTLAGALFEAALLSAAVWRRGLIGAPRWGQPCPAVSRVLAEYTPVACSFLILGGSLIVDQALAATLGAGSVSALNYGTRLVAVILSIGSSSLGTAVLPRFSQLSAVAHWSELRRVFRTLAMLAMAAALPVTALLIACSQPLARILFLRGAFTADASRLVGTIQTFSLLQIPFSILLVLVLRMVSSLKLNRLLMPLAVVSLIANALFDLALMRPFGVAGIALSTSLVHATGLGFLVWALWRSQFWKVSSKMQSAAAGALS